MGMSELDKVICGLEWIINDIVDYGNREHAEKYVDDIQNAIKYLNKQANKSKREPLLPCKCGCNRRQHWYGKDIVKLRCEKCDFEVIGKNEADARRKWNEAVRDGHPRSDTDWIK